MLGRILLLVLIAWGAWSYFTGRPIEPGPGVHAPRPPLQQPPEDSTPFAFGDYRITPLARFHATARVLGTERYRFDRGADLVPVDLALGWGALSESRHLTEIDISQGNRFYFWRAKTLPLPREEIARQSANMHLIPRDTAMRERLLGVRPGQLVSFEGQLVEVVDADGWRWRSSLSREDTGNGACELVWLERFEVRDPRK
jgi:hypothetical protein